jgi:hypothetical protein
MKEGRPSQHPVREARLSDEFCGEDESCTVYSESA